MIAETQSANLNRENMGRRWKYHQRLLNTFWTSWRKDYLLDLKSAYRTETLKPTELKVGAVELIEEEKMPRQTWKTGLIERLFPGRDGLTRLCTVCAHTGTLRRLVQLIYPLEKT